MLDKKNFVVDNVFVNDKVSGTQMYLGARLFVFKGEIYDT